MAVPWGRPARGGALEAPSPRRAARGRCDTHCLLDPATTPSAAFLKLRATDAEDQLHYAAELGGAGCSAAALASTCQDPGSSHCAHGGDSFLHITKGPHERQWELLFGLFSLAPAGPRQQATIGRFLGFPTPHPVGP